MNRTELVASMAEKAGISKKDADSALKAFIESVEAEIKAGGKVQIVGFGTFDTSKRAARTGRNPHDGSVLKIPAMTVAKFKAGAELKAAAAASKAKKNK